jgi:hypothetical protein
MYIVGSSALKHWFSDWREPMDIDYIATQSEVDEYLHINKDDIVTVVPNRCGITVFQIGSIPIEFEIAKDGNSTEQLCAIIKDQYLININDILRPNIIYTMKMSHRYMKNSPHFKKTMDDIIELRNRNYGTIPPYLKEWFKIREKETYNYKHPKLKTSKKDFFDPNIGVNYVYDHDSIHETVKHFSRPAYTMIKDDQADVFCSKEKFFSLPETIKLFTVLEESYTLALERSQIPNNFNIDRKKSFLIALEKVCTSVSSGWWREYAYESYYKVIELYDEGYVEKFKNGLSHGVVKPFKGSENGSEVESAEVSNTE